MILCHSRSSVPALIVCIFRYARIFCIPRCPGAKRNLSLRSPWELVCLSSLSSGYRLIPIPEITSCFVECIESDSLGETGFESWTVEDSRKILTLRLLLRESWFPLDSCGIKDNCKMRYSYLSTTPTQFPQHKKFQNATTRKILWKLNSPFTLPS